MCDTERSVSRGRHVVTASCVFAVFHVGFAATNWWGPESLSLHLFPSLVYLPLLTAALLLLRQPFWQCSIAFLTVIQSAALAILPCPVSFSCFGSDTHLSTFIGTLAVCSIAASAAIGTAYAIQSKLRSAPRTAMSKRQIGRYLALYSFKLAAQHVLVALAIVYVLAGEYVLRLPSIAGVSSAIYIGILPLLVYVCSVYSPWTACSGPPRQTR